MSDTQVSGQVSGSAASSGRTPRIVRAIYAARTGAFVVCFGILGVLCVERNAGMAVWLSLALTFLVYPHLAYRLSARSADPRAAEGRNLLFDAVLFGAWTAQFGFPVWMGYALATGAVLNNVVTRGLRGLVPAVLAFGLAALGWGAFKGFEFRPETSALVVGLALAASTAYAVLVASIVFQQTERVVRARRELKSSEERYRLITENAADLIAMMDDRARLHYASPSWARLLGEHAVEPGRDAFAAAVHQDGVAARAAIASLEASGGAARFMLRITGSDGRLRTLECVAHAVRQSPSAGRLAVVVSQDVTELQDSRDKLEIAAMAFENMSEAVMISSAGGKVLMVNKAYTRITGIPAEEVTGADESAFRQAMQPPEFHAAIQAEVQRTGRWAGSTWSRRRDGNLYREWRTVSAVQGEEGGVAFYVTVFSEMDPAQRSG